MNRRDANSLDAYLTREPRETESDLYCPRCDCASADCAYESEHCTHWITYREKARGDLADYLYDRD